MAGGAEPDGDLRLGNKDDVRTYQLAGAKDADTCMSVNLHVEVLDLRAVASEQRLPCHRQPPTSGARPSLQPPVGDRTQTPDPRDPDEC